MVKKRGILLTILSYAMLIFSVNSIAVIPDEESVKKILQAIKTSDIESVKTLTKDMGSEEINVEITNKAQKGDTQKGDRFIFDTAMTRRTSNAKAGEDYIKEHAAPYCAAWT